MENGETDSGKRKQKSGNLKKKKKSENLRICVKCFASPWMFICTRLPQTAGRDGGSIPYHLLQQGVGTVSHNTASPVHTFIHTYMCICVLTHVIISQ